MWVSLKSSFYPQTVIGMDSYVKALIRSVDFGKHWYCVKRKIKPKWFFIFQLQRCWSGDSNRVYVSTYARLVNFRMQFFDMVNIPWSLHPLLHKCHGEQNQTELKELRLTLISRPPAINKHPKEGRWIDSAPNSCLIDLISFCKCGENVEMNNELKPFNQEHWKISNRNAENSLNFLRVFIT